MTQSLKPRKAKRRAIRQRRRRIKRACFGLAAVLLVFLGCWFAVRGSVNKVPKEIICDHIYIGDVDVSGMTAKEAEAALEKKLDEYREVRFTLTAKEAEGEASAGDLGFYMKNRKDLIKQAVSYGKEGGIWKRYFVLKELKEHKKVFEVSYAVSAEAVERTVGEKLPKLKDGAKDAQIRRENGAFLITDEVEGLAVDIEASVKVIDSYFRKGCPKEGGTIELVTKTAVPNVTRAQLENVRDLLGTFTTVCGSGGGRVQNIIAGAGHINGALLMPGEEYSGNAAMEPYTAENGFTEAGSYENGQVVQSMGGGICQVSSTLYNAVILAELEIVERAAHSMTVSYVEPSMDAAIAGDYKDLKFKNNTEFPVYIEGYVSGGKITFNIYGKETRPASRRVEFVSEVVSSTPAGEKFVETADPIGLLQKASSGYQGMKARLWKVVYENGKEVSRKVVNNSTYSASDAVWNVGTASENADASALVKAAVASNNRQAIEEAIRNAKEMLSGAQPGQASPEAAGTP